jgi:hypothetical protein
VQQPAGLVNLVRDVADAEQTDAEPTLGSGLHVRLPVVE